MKQFLAVACLAVLALIVMDWVRWLRVRRA